MTKKDSPAGELRFAATLPPQKRTGTTQLCLGLEELAAAGVPARKARRVLAELQHQVDADPALNRRPVLTKLARRIARFLL